jgi:hypothetical protein
MHHWSLTILSIVIYGDNIQGKEATINFVSLVNCQYCIIDLNFAVKQLLI